jgi:uncharacterized protein GlcG (DUF336 family)
MSDLTLSTAQAILDAALKQARQMKLLPVAVAVLDARGALRAFGAEDGTSLKRGEIARGKAYGAIALGVGSRTLTKMALDRPHFIGSMHTLVDGPLVPAPGGVLIRDGAGRLLGAVGISGDTADHDEAAALHAIHAAGLMGDPGVQ